MAANPEPNERDREMALKWWRDDNTGIEDLPDLLATVREEGRREAQAWRPIETAPKDGSLILVGGRGRDDKWGHWLVRTALTPYTTATHWLPLEPPR